MCPHFFKARFRRLFRFFCALLLRFLEPAGRIRELKLELAIRSAENAEASGDNPSKHHVHEDDTGALNEALHLERRRAGGEDARFRQRSCQGCGDRSEVPRHETEEGGTGNTDRWVQMHCSTNRR